MAISYKLLLFKYQDCIFKTQTAQKQKSTERRPFDYHDEQNQQWFSSMYNMYNAVILVSDNLRILNLIRIHVAVFSARGTLLRLRDTVVLMAYNLQHWIVSKRFEQVIYENKSELQSPMVSVDGSLGQ